MKDNKTLPWNLYYKESIIKMLFEMSNDTRTLIDFNGADQKTRLISYLSEIQLLMNKVNKGDFAPEHYPDYGCDDDLVDVSDIKDYLSNQEFDLIFKEQDINHLENPSTTDISYLIRLKYRYKAYFDIRFRLDVLQSLVKM